MEKLRYPAGIHDFVQVQRTGYTVVLSFSCMIATHVVLSWLTGVAGTPSSQMCEFRLVRNLPKYHLRTLVMVSF